MFKLRKIQNKCELGCSNSRNKPGVKILKNVGLLTFFVTNFVQKSQTEKIAYTRFWPKSVF